MEDADVNMGDINRGWLPFKIPYPPEFPDSIRLEGGTTVVNPDLERYAKCFGATDNPDCKGFQTRQVNEDDPIGGKFHEDDFDIEYRLGSSSESPYWNDLVHKWGLQVLDRAGFINVPITESEEDDPVGRYARNVRNIYKDMNEQIHPVFRKEMWQNMSDSQYKTVRIPLLLASAFLDDPTTLRLFHAISAPERMITFLDPNLGLCRKLDFSDTLTESELKATYDKMADMRKSTSFFWENPEKLIKEGAVAMTTVLLDMNGHYKPASGPLTRKSKIGISWRYYNAMRHYEIRSQDNTYETFFEDCLGMARIPQDRRPGKFDLDSAIRRTELLFACDLVHEFAHAFSYAYFERPDLPSPTVQFPDEPWLPGNRSNELGLAVTNYILKGVPNPNRLFHPPMSHEEEHRQYFYAPYGLWFANTWDAWRKNNGNEDVLEDGKAADFSKRFTYFPVPQQQVNEMYHKDTWELYVVRFGLDWISLAKTKEWAAHRIPGSNPDYPGHGAILR